MRTLHRQPDKPWTLTDSCLTCNLGPRTDAKMATCYVKTSLGADVGDKQQHIDMILRVPLLCWSRLSASFVCVVSAPLHCGCNMPRGSVRFSQYRPHFSRRVHDVRRSSADKSSLYPAYLAEDKMHSEAERKRDAATKRVFKGSRCFFVSSNDGLYRAWNFPTQTEN